MLPDNTSKNSFRLLLLSALIIIFITLLSALYLRNYFKSAQIETYLGQNKVIRQVLPQEQHSALQVLKKIAESESTEYILIDAEGKYIAGTDAEKPGQLFDYSFFNDVKKALKGEVSWMEGADYGESDRNLFISYPVISGSRILFIIRNKISLDHINHSLTLLYITITALCFAAILMIYAALKYHSASSNTAFKKIRNFVSELSVSNNNQKLYSEFGGEADTLTEELNKLSQASYDKFSALNSTRNELEAVFSGMREGVLLVDSDLKIIKINRAAFEMMGTASQQSEGKSIEEVVRNIHLQNYIRRVLKNGVPEEIELNLHENKEITVQVYSSIISDLQNRKIALMVVLNNISQLKQLETVRKDFVANVSHELKTPITSIQGFVETLLDGAMHNPDENKRFLEIIHRQTERLNFIFNDLLILAGLEKESNSRLYNIDNCDLVSLVESVKEVCQLKAGKKNLLIDSSGLEVKLIKANSSLLEQALVNLLDNAVKYTPAGKAIKIISRQQDDMVRISVKDNGMGIENSHLGRIFERFYRADQSRSREEGGTGLGLAIVKHIALLHGGKVDVQSEPGKGSEFAILIPNL